MQGNLDPIALFAPWPQLRSGAPGRCSTPAAHTGWPGYIFNLGHGILPQTPVDNVRRLVDFVHDALHGQKGKIT